MKFLTVISFIFLSQIANALPCGDLVWENIAIDKDLTRIVFTHSKNKAIAVWDVATGVAKPLTPPKLEIQELFYIDRTQLVAVGTNDGQGPYFQVWDLTTGLSDNFNNAVFNDMAGDIFSNLSQNKQYIVTSGQLFYGGWGYHVVDLKTGKTVLKLRGMKGQAQITDDLTKLYVVTKRNYGNSYLQILNVSEDEVEYENYLSTTYYTEDRMNWWGNKIIFSGGNALVFDTETKKENNMFSLGGLISYSNDFNIRAHKNINEINYTISGKNPLYIRNLKPNEKTFKAELSQDGKKMLAITNNNKILMFDTDQETFDTLSECSFSN